MLIEDLQKVVNGESLPTNVADMYLRIYVSDIDWKPHIAKFWANTKNKITEDDSAKMHMRKSIACASLIPIYDKKVIPDPPQNLLFWCPTWSQFNERDWVHMYKKVVEDDIKIRNNRKKLLQYGVVDSIDYLPLTRQAFNWLYTKAEETKVIGSNKEDLIKKFENLVKIYGGAVICNVFAKHETNISKVLNWRSGYFIEKEIYKIYTPDQISKIKQTEISKIDPKYVKKLTKNKES
jgi:hypothetical protein